jgi:redox-sensitive bicupin YhaK (pirin superfamily)
VFVPGEGGAECEVAAGTLGGVQAGGASPQHSWAADASNDVGVFLVTLPPGSSFTLPPAAVGAKANRAAYVVEGPTDATRAAKVRVGGTPVPRGRAAFTLRAELPCLLENDNSDGDAVHVLVLQGVPIGEPVAQRGPFVMNTDAELAQAFADYRTTQFGGWPWPDTATVFPRDQDRFADMIVESGKKVRVLPPGAQPAAKAEL